MEIEYEDFKKLEMKTGTIVSVEKVAKTNKLYRIMVDIGGKTIQIVSSLVPYYEESDLIAKTVIVVTNLAPAKFAGLISEGMLLCAETDDGKKCTLLTVDEEIENGTSVT